MESNENLSSEAQEVKNDFKNDLKNIFKKMSSHKSVFYIYPIKFSVDVKMKQIIVNKAVTRLEEYLEKEENVKDMSWRVVSRSRQEVVYEASVLVEKPTQIIRIVGVALNKLEIFLEEVSE